MIKLLIATLVGLCLCSTAVFGREIIIRNMTNDYTESNPVRPTNIKFDFLNTTNNRIFSSGHEKKLDGLLLKPGGKIVVNAKDFPFEINKNNLFVDFSETSGKMLLGVMDMEDGNIGIQNLGIRPVTAMYQPYYSTKLGDRGNIKEIDFYYANTFFSA